MPTMRKRGGSRRMPATVFGFALLALSLIALVIAVGALLNALPSLNPFGSETVDRTQPAVLQSIEPLSQFRAATANLEVIVELERDSNVLPAFISGEKVLFVAAGRVDAGVDFTDVGADSIQVSDDGTEVTITLPAARLYEARVDPERSRVYDRDRGLVDRLQSVFEDSPTEDRSLFVLSERRLQEAAQADPELLRTAERNTRSMLVGLLRGLGFERVTVNFTQAT